jgi:hypothetical protein
MPFESFSRLLDLLPQLSKDQLAYTLTTIEDLLSELEEKEIEREV